MLTFSVEVKADRRVLEMPGTFSQSRSQVFACAKMASAPKKPRQSLLSMFFSKGQHELKTLDVFFLISI